MKILSAWLRTYLPSLAVSDRQLADDLTLRGIAVEGVHDLGSGPDGRPLGSLLEMDITTNRVDAMNHFGIAREAAAIYNIPLAPLAAELPAAQPHAAPFPVRIDPAVQHLCGRFTARVLRNVSIGESTGEVRGFFDLLGQRTISNAVDASNFTLLGMGHPTHAFDLDHIAGEILVRFAHLGEKLVLLDGTERTLEADDLVIADRQHALSLAGVMGGLSSSITAGTRNILVEAAWFDPASIRRSARRHGLHTDASHRFERGADFNAAPLANDLVASLILRSGGGTLQGELIDLLVPEVASRTRDRAAVPLSVPDVQRHLGATVEDSEGRSALTTALIQQVLTALGCTLTPGGLASGASLARTTLHARQDASPGGFFSVTLPSWRLDLERPIDLIEEVARVFGYNRFRNTLPTALPVRERPGERAERAMRSRLLALGFSEAVSSTFTGVPDSELFAPESAEEPLYAGHVPLENPLSEEVSNLRPSLVPGMLGMLALNLNRGVSDVRLFEQGHVFAGTRAPEDLTTIADVTERLELTLGLTAAAPTSTPLHSAADASLFELKGAIESLLSLFDLSSPAAGSAGTGARLPQPMFPAAAPALTFSAGGAPAWLEPHRAAVALVGGTPLAVFGELSTVEGARRKLRQPVLIAAIDLARLLTFPLRQPIARELSRFQAVTRDFSFVFPDTARWGEITAAIHALALPDLRSLSPVEIFRDPKGKAVPLGSYSLLLRTVFQSATRTLTEEELTASSDRLIAALTVLGGSHRG